ncbi:DUF5906 domain-containing protein [Geovibrio ferrireducens]|uniref:DUF5906 domain-containing protein n=1 Tax=Geovibrio ferrireducens TaxID=46201 RepID=UPI00224827B8|nr:DUF5906 domain-containing protein [Geovibrio ferrireducens]
MEKMAERKVTLLLEADEAERLGILNGDYINVLHSGSGQYSLEVDMAKRTGTESTSDKPFNFETSETRRFIMHLCNGDESSFQWVMNWLAVFYQTRKRCPLALCFHGVQSSGKSIFYECILSDLYYGKAVIYDDDALAYFRISRVKEIALFYLPDLPRSGRDRNHIKELITSDSVMCWEKYREDKRCMVIGNVFITTNSPREEVEEAIGVHRVMPIKTGPALRQAGFDPFWLIKALKVEHNDFKEYLLQFPIDLELYDKHPAMAVQS